MGTKPPGKVRSMDFRRFQGPAGAEPPWKGKKGTPGQIPDYAPDDINVLITYLSSTHCNGTF